MPKTPYFERTVIIKDNFEKPFFQGYLIGCIVCAIVMALSLPPLKYLSVSTFIMSFIFVSLGGTVGLTGTFFLFRYLKKRPVKYCTFLFAAILLSVITFAVFSPYIAFTSNSDISSPGIAEYIHAMKHWLPVCLFCGITCMAIMASMATEENPANDS